jgi:hypothetical protein
MQDTPLQYEPTSSTFTTANVGLHLEVDGMQDAVPRKSKSISLWLYSMNLPFRGSMRSASRSCFSFSHNGDVRKFVGNEPTNVQYVWNTHRFLPRTLH